MRYYILFSLITLATYAASSLVAALAVWVSSPFFRRHLASRPAAARARILAAARLLPVAAGAASALLVASVFYRYEPRDTAEVPGVLLMAFALTTVALAGLAAGRVLKSWRASATCAKLLRQCGDLWARNDGQRIWVIDSAYPVAAVTGLFRTRLLISTRIVRECTPRELDAVIRHETAHVRRRDNLVRAAMTCLPDPLVLLPAGRELAADWAAAAEEAADDEAAGPRAEARMELAAALVRVARMAEGPPPRWMPALAFYEGTNLENRVHRLLLDGPGVKAVSTVRIAAAGVFAAAATLLAADGLSADLHNVMELAVRYLP